MADSNSTSGISKSFSDFGLSDWLVKQCSVVGIKKPTAVQGNLIPEILKGTQVVHHV